MTLVVFFSLPHHDKGRVGRDLTAWRIYISGELVVTRGGF